MTNSTIKTPMWFKIISIIALLWNLLGILGFFANLNLSEEALAQFPEAEQAIYRNTPIWVTIAFAIAVFAGTIGSLGLVLRKSWAKHFLIASLVGVLLQMFHAFILANGLEIYGIERMIMPLFILVIAILLPWLAKKVQSKEWYIKKP